jgi:hypothetical protein
MNDSAGRPPSGPEDSGTPAPGAPQPTPGAVPTPPPAPVPSFGQPPAPPYGHPYGYGYGHPGGPAPWPRPFRAPQPGVIPLRPLDVGDLLAGTFATIRRHWRPTVVLSLVIGLVFGAVALVLERAAVQDPDYRRAVTGDDVHTSLHYTVYHSGFTGASLLVTVAQAVLSSALLALVTGNAVIGRPSPLGTVCRDGLRRLLPMLGLAVLESLVIVLPVVVCALPGLAVLDAGHETGGIGLIGLGIMAGSLASCWLYVSTSLAAPALVLERSGVLTSLRRSFKLVRGAWWRVFGVELLVLLVTLITGIVVDLLVDLFAGGGSTFGLLTSTDPGALASWSALITVGVASLVAGLFTLPLTAYARSLLYMDLRIRREELDVELALAAGIPNPRTGL